MAKPRTDRLKRPRPPLPDCVRAALAEHGLLAAQRARPAHPQNDSVGWIIRAKQKATQEKRLAQLLDELTRGNAYMKMT